jgi:transcriptional regulator with XRE-family HTH domain
MSSVAPAPRFSGAKLKDLRTGRRLGRQVLCSRVRENLSITTLMRWEQGKTTPDFDDVCRLAAALGVNVADFAEVA